ncbi:MAG TPA: bifunctional oligoribonuclease/PAP phosphatase NrnA [bacterium]|nr:bifunctional oligoribonuclease/PAP phosphatase NrnA [bacterium]
MNFKELHDKLVSYDNYSIFGHMNPDGDSIGAIIAMYRILKGLGKNAVMYSRDGVPDYFRFLPDTDKIIGIEQAGGLNVDTALLVDCGGPKRTGDEFVPALEGANAVFVIDHHATNSGFGDLSIVDPEASSTCEIIARYAEHSGLEIDPETATCLYCGIMYDTGRFLHSNTTYGVMRLASEMVRQGADPRNVAFNVYNRRSQAHLRLLGHVLDNMQTTADGRICWAVVERKIYDELGARDEDAEGIVEMLGSYNGCEVHATFSQTSNLKSRASMRSAGRVNIGRICAAFGGGGHDFAAGIRSGLPLNELAEKVIAEVLKAVRETD